VSGVGQSAAQSAAIQVSDAWVQAQPAGAQVAAGYLRIRNRGDVNDRLLAVSTPRAARTELHAITMEGAVARMRPLRYGVSVPARGQVALTPSTMHIMFSSMDAPFVAGQTVRLRLTFQRAGVIEVNAPVRTR